MPLLSLDDFKGHPMNSDCSAWESLLDVARVASVKLHQESKRKRSLCDGKDQRKKKKQEQVQGPNPPPDLPEEFKKKIEEMGGTEVSLLIQKSLYSTDLSAQHNRLSLPLNQMKNQHFLHKRESLPFMKKKNHALDVVLIEPSLRTRNIVFGKWELTKSSCYVLRSCWMKMAIANGLKLNDVVQVWSFRMQQQLCMALVKLPPSN